MTNTQQSIGAGLVLLLIFTAESPVFISLPVIALTACWIAYTCWDK